HFIPCNFIFGTDWDYLMNNRSSGVANEVNYVTKWIVDANFNDNKVYGEFLNFCVENKKTPVFYAYIIAKAAALGDADVGGKLGTEGAAWIKNNFNNVKNLYNGFAQNVASRMQGSGISPIWLMEPDYYQYVSGGQTSPLSFQQAGDYMGQLIDIIRQHIPDAMIAIDISAWIEDQNNTQNYYGAMPLNKTDFLFTSGGQSQAGSSNIKGENKMTWSGIYNVTKKGIIADCGYGAGGGSTGHNAQWDNISNLTSRINDGVVAVTQKNPNGSWGIASIRSQLASLSVKSCGSVGVQCTLTVNAGTGGKVTREPDKSVFAKGDTVKLIATPDNRYNFKGWSGGATGSNETVKIIMDDNKTVTAQFEAIPENMRTVTVKVTGGSGSVSKSPVNAFYSTGSTVTLTAKPVSGVSVFEGWSGGGLSGNQTTATITVGSTDIVVTATFRDTLRIDTLKIEAESFIQKNGEKLVTETKNGVTSIGYIESGYSTTYKMDVDIAGLYNVVFRVGSGLQSSNFSVSINGQNAGKVDFQGTLDNWDAFHNESLESPVELDDGSHTVQLSYGNAVNVDWIMFVLDKPIVSVLNKKHVSQQNLRVVAQKNGFIASLPQMHDFYSYSLYDCNGRIAGSGPVNSCVSQLSFSNLTQNVWILRLNGAHKSATIRAAVLR
ncbi:MAG TPA: carbohydrate-binding protein, partial [Chitinispirillaceae bacterium]|nr:carbohydrate-binding protein [Chitinispirillaceae bacterium]